MSDTPISLSTGGPPTTVIPEPPAEVAEALANALALDGAERRTALGEIAARWPRFIDVWAALGAQATDPIESYAYFRVGYHRGLDTLRASGWRGSGYVRWAAPSNRGFLRALLGLQRMAAAIGEDDEDVRCQQFLAQLDPSGVPSDE